MQLVANLLGYMYDRKKAVRYNLINSNFSLISRLIKT